MELGSCLCVVVGGLGTHSAQRFQSIDLETEGERGGEKRKKKQRKGGEGEGEEGKWNKNNTVQRKSTFD